MKKLLILIIGIFVVGHVMAQEITPDEVVSKHLEAIGQEKLLNTETIKLTGTMGQQGMDIKVIVHQKKPEIMRMEMEVQGMKIIMVVDGEKGWTINPMMGSMEPQNLPPEAIADLKKQNRTDPTLSWEHPLDDWKKNGAQIELIGKEEVEGSDAYHLKVIFNDNAVINYFIDASSFYLLKVVSQESIQGQVVGQEVVCSDFENYEGIVVPKKIAIYMNGQVAQDFIMETCEFDVPIADLIFEKPVVEGK